MYRTAVLLGSHGDLRALSLTQVAVSEPPASSTPPLPSMTIKGQNQTHLSPGRAEAGGGGCLLPPNPASTVVITRTCLFLCAVW